MIWAINKKDKSEQKNDPKQKLSFFFLLSGTQWMASFLSSVDILRDQITKTLTNATIKKVLSLPRIKN